MKKALVVLSICLFYFFMTIAIMMYDKWYYNKIAFESNAIYIACQEGLL